MGLMSIPRFEKEKVFILGRASDAQIKSSRHHVSTPKTVPRPCASSSRQHPPSSPRPPWTRRTRWSRRDAPALGLERRRPAGPAGVVRDHRLLAGRLDLAGRLAPRVLTFAWGPRAPARGPQPRARTSV